jgi:prevent-host-death family protein
VAESGQELIVAQAADGLSFDQLDRPVHADITMRKVQASDAKTHLPQLLDDVERGKTIIITRHSRPMACLVPDAEKRRMEIATAIDGIQALRKQTGKVTLDEILEARHEGHNC